MAHVTADRIRDYSTTTGTGSFTVSGSAPNGYKTFSAVATTSDTFYYAIQHQTANEWEVGLGTYSATNTVARTTVYASSNSGSLVNFSAGTKDVFITLAASRTTQMGAGGVVDLPASSTVGGVAITTISGTQTLTNKTISAAVTASGLTMTSARVLGRTTASTGAIEELTAVPVSLGGNGLTSTPSNGQIDIGNGTGFTRATLTAGAGIIISNGAGTITIRSGTLPVTTSGPATSANIGHLMTVGANLSITTTNFVAGDVLSIYNTGATTITISLSSGTLQLAGAGAATSGSRNLAGYGLATVTCVASGTFVISGAGVS